MKPRSKKYHRETEEKSRWNLRLYVAGNNAKAAKAIGNLKQICENQLKGKYRITVIDLMKHPRFAHDDQIVAVPTVRRIAPLPVRNIIGDLSNTERLMIGLGLLDERAVQRM